MLVWIIEVKHGHVHQKDTLIRKPDYQLLNNNNNNIGFENSLVKPTLKMYISSYDLIIDKFVD